MGRLDGKVALIMGATRAGNMGQAIARRFIDEGATVVVSGRGREGLDAFAAETGATALPCDVRRRAEIETLADAVVARHGGLDIAVNAAATGALAPFEEETEEQVDEMLSIIFKGGLFFMQAMVGRMKRPVGRGGSIITVSSAVADIMSENHCSYMGAKAGLNHMTRFVAYEYGRHGIRANILSPGLTITPMLGAYDVPGMAEAYAREYPLGRIGTVDDVANAALFMAGDECFMTGETFHVTGGLTLRRNPTSAEIMASIAAAGAA
ncbi:SDR family oxidoreductase [Sphingomonas histidinilytica]|jgi:NAD(P)-dependent dehydrogenase (short-subunit alcohol dehydrogenase family)|uniref:NAD(P)-dependent dehydrogenase, short-chain alcohol dehydrogenase family n=1 Tax=Rhizorhabdus histidinilytica TaxID=439228 RepID=A0A1T5A5A9_9SPHN|nr:SDR family oxidoreductase [Rhizorhabdus histidinilytica]MBO9376209.1 SDR family oxidoreductase [Rhizorhabdus histidinilytica]QEH78237.1 SDR family oxidoreductase [Sphingomonas sp. C8-2]SKB30161.1 NAD(P)-dependent dehydrogenase, short-chain alcohol dehydrogenase family [Rhizorhabdus histidinilytica]